MFEEIISPLFSTQWGQRASYVIAVALAISCFLISIFTIFSWYNDFSLIRQSSTQSLSVASSPYEQLPALINQLPSRHLFGKLNEERSVLSNTKLNLRLLGVIKASPDMVSRVIISKSGEKSKIFKKGDELLSDVKIHAIIVDDVILMTHGRLEKLPLQRPPLTFKGLPQSLFNKEQ